MKTTIRLEVLDIMVKQLFEEYLQCMDTIIDFVGDCNYNDDYTIELEFTHEERLFIKENWSYVLDRLFVLGSLWEKGEINNIDEIL